MPISDHFIITAADKPLDNVVIDQSIIDRLNLKFGYISKSPFDGRDEDDVDYEHHASVKMLKPGDYIIYINNQSCIPIVVNDKNFMMIPPENLFVAYTIGSID